MATDHSTGPARRVMAALAAAAACAAVVVAVAAQPARPAVQLKPPRGVWVALAPDGNSPQARAEAIRDWLVKDNPGLDRTCPGLAELVRRLAPRVDQRNRLSARAMADLLPRFGLYQELADVVASSGLAPEFRNVLLKYYADLAFDPHATVNVEQERRSLAVAGKSGRVVRIGRPPRRSEDDEFVRPTASGLIEAVKAVWPDWKRQREVSQKLVLDYIASVNPGVSPAGSYRAATWQVEEPWEHLAVALGGGQWRIWLYRIEPGSLVLIPDGEALRRAGDGDNLDLAHSWISDLNVLDGLKFTRLDVSASATADLAPLRYHGDLRRLKAQRLAADDLSALADLPLEELDVSQSRVADIAAARKMPLVRLDVSSTPVADLTPLAGRGLVELDISHTRVKDLAPLAGLPLKRLRMAGVPAPDLAPLAKLAALAELDISDTKVADLRPLARCPLVRLDAAGSAVLDVTPLAAAPLEELDLSRTDFRDLASLHRLHVRRLYLGETKFTDVSPLKGLKLDLLDLNQSAVRRLAPLLDVQVAHLALDRWSVPYADVEVLTKHPTLKTMGSLRSERMSIQSWMGRHKRYGPKSRAVEGGPCAPPKAAPATAPARAGTPSCTPER